MSVPNFGYIPKEGNFNYAKVETLSHNQTSQVICADVADDAVAETKLQVGTLCVVGKPSIIPTIPKGAKIEQVEIKIVDASSLDPNLEFCLGYLSNSVTAAEALTSLSQRTFADDSRATAALLQTYGSLVVDEQLAGDKIVHMNKILGKDKNALPPASVIIREPVDLTPALTVMKGKLAPGTLMIEYTYRM